MTLSVPTADSSNRKLQRLKYWLLSQLSDALVMGRVYTSAIQGTASCVFLALRETCMVELYTQKAPRKPLTFSNWQICRIFCNHTQHHWLCSTYSAICVLSLVLKARAIVLNNILSGLFAVCSSRFIQIMGCKAGDEVIAHRHCIFCFYLIGPPLAVYTASLIVLHSSSSLLWFCSSRGSSVTSWKKNLDSENENFCPFPDILNHEHVVCTMDTYILKKD